MGKGKLGAARTAGGAALLALWVAAAAPAQSLPAAQPTVLDSRAATRLLMSQVSPDYPAVAHTNYIQGPVQMELLVGSDGHVQKAHVLHGNPLLAASALTAVYRWLYRPCVTADGAVPFRTQVKVVFDLRHGTGDRFPTRPERDLEQRVKLPQVQESDLSRSGPSVRLRVLVGDDGRAMDSMLVSGSSSLFAPAQESVAQWKFEPARWGNLAVPWYLDVNVPVGPGYRSQASVAPRTP
jgi:outer membrane biosynthesis protein TonB